MKPHRLPTQYCLTMRRSTGTSLGFLFYFLVVFLLVVADQIHGSELPKELVDVNKVEPRLPPGGASPRRSTPGLSEPKLVKVEKVQTPAPLGAPPRQLWPELVGVGATEALMQIKKDRPDVEIQVIPSGDLVTTDYNIHRVRIFTDDSGNVSKPPRIG